MNGLLMYRYFLSLPTEQLELWFALEAERFRVSSHILSIALCRF